MQRYRIVLSSDDYINITVADIESLFNEILKAESGKGTSYIMVSNSGDKKVYINTNHINMIIPLEYWE